MTHQGLSMPSLLVHEDNQSLVKPLQCGRPEAEQTRHIEMLLALGPPSTPQTVAKSHQTESQPPETESKSDLKTVRSQVGSFDFFNSQHR